MFWVAFVQGAETETLAETSTDAEALTDGVETLTLVDGSIDADTLTLVDGSIEADTLTEVEMSIGDELMPIELEDDSSIGRMETSPEAAVCSTWPRSSPSGYCAV